MRLSIAVTAALSGLATAASSKATVYLFRSEPAKPRDYAPELQRQVARLIFSHRLGVDDSFTIIDELEALPDAEEAVSHINAYGRKMLPLFTEPEPEPSKLMVVLEGLEPGQMDEVMEGREKAFVIDEAPNSAANGVLIDGELGPAGAPTSSCVLERAINPLDKDCFSGSASIIRYDVKKDASVIEALQKAAPKLARFAETGEMETTILLLPEASRTSRLNSWSSRPSASILRRRQSETILSTDETVAISDEESTLAAPSEAFPNLADLPSLALCYASYNSCVTATGNCSSHGVCENTLAGRDDDGNRLPAKEGNPVCFTCQCKGTRAKTGSVTRWAGGRCDKVDYSVPFALFAGFTIVMLFIVTAAVRLVYNIGEEPLPGVLGAGVSKKN